MKPGIELPEELAAGAIQRHQFQSRRVRVERTADDERIRLGIPVFVHRESPRLPQHSHVVRRYLCQPRIAILADMTAIRHPTRIGWLRAGRTANSQRGQHGDRQTRRVAPGLHGQARCRLKRGIHESANRPLRVRRIELRDTYWRDHIKAGRIIPIGQVAAVHAEAPAPGVRAETLPAAQRSIPAYVSPATLMFSRVRCASCS